MTAGQPACEHIIARPVRPVTPRALILIKGSTRTEYYHAQRQSPDRLDLSGCEKPKFVEPILLCVTAHFLLGETEMPWNRVSELTEPRRIKGAASTPSYLQAAPFTL
jgi:hypothetical protein